MKPLTVLATGALGLLVAATALAAAPAAIAAEDCPDDTACIHDDQGHWAHYRNGADDVRAQGVQGGVYIWNRTQTNWCIYSQTKMSGDDAKVGPGGTDDQMKFFSLQRVHIFC